MKIIDNVSELFGDDLRALVAKGDRISAAAAGFSIHAFAALEEVLRSVDTFDFVFTGPSFVTDHGNARAAHRGRTVRFARRFAHCHAVCRSRSGESSQ